MCKWGFGSRKKEGRLFTPLEVGTGDNNKWGKKKCLMPYPTLFIVSASLFRDGYEESHELSIQSQGQAAQGREAACGR